MMNANGRHPPERTPAMIDRWRDAAAVVRMIRADTGRGPTPFRNIHAAGLRVVYDFADPDGSVMMIATGQSGHPFSRWYDHLAGSWARGDTIPMSMNDEDAAGPEGAGPGDADAPTATATDASETP